MFFISRKNFVQYFFVTVFCSLCSLQAADYKQEILDNPQVVLNVIRPLYTDFFDNLQQCVARDADTVFFLIKQLIGKYELQHPIFMLGECNSVNNSCNLYRKNNIFVRKPFETALVDALMQTSNACKKSVQYVSFASGEMFQDFVVLVKFLQQQPMASVVIHMIDPLYEKYIFLRNLFGDTSEITVDTNVFCKHTFSDICKKYCAVMPYNNQLAFYSACFNVNMHSMKCEGQAQQFLKALKSFFPMSNVRIIMHTSVDEYSVYVQKHKIAYADVIGGVDFQDVDSDAQSATYFFVKLCLQVLQKKPSAKIVALIKGVRPIDYQFEPYLYVKQ